MVYFDSFEEFQAASREVYAREPRKVTVFHENIPFSVVQTRYSCKYSSHSGSPPEVVLKVTDDVSVCINKIMHHS